MPHARHRSAICASVVALLALLQVPAQAQYQWKDKRGQLHLSDQPPPRNIPDKDVIKRPTARPAPQAAVAATAGAASAARPTAASAPVDPELAQRRAAADQASRAQAQAEAQRVAAQRADNCQRARQHLATLDTGSRLVRFNERGERVVLDDAARAQEAAQARNVVAADCR